MNKKIRKIIEVFFNHDELFKYEILQSREKNLTKDRSANIIQQLYDHIANTIMLDSIYNVNEDHRRGL